MTQEGIKKVKTYVISIVTILGSIIAIYEGYIAISEQMNETAREKIKTYTLPVIKTEIQFAIDSITSARKTSFRQELSEGLSVEKSEVSNVISKWYKEEQGVSHVGLYLYLNDNRLKYIHTDGERYRPFYDSARDAYYFINNDDVSEWCK